ncbi:hypothetical protein Pmgp_00281 [Pelotomaculum propionicicum]|uniref:Uncharacterized protein n=1 Tax=Pelotomaculum propionicicum TaxID=258475 RepID=A0A4Y7RYJ7_9FIRM|nr:hypothetical protein Pmgp_00281 [Pelotomaculum propionicicum]
MIIITELDGRVIWMWPELIRHWASTSRIPAAVIVENCHVRMVGDWGYVKGVDMGTFATVEMALEAKRRIELEMPRAIIREVVS